jgi:hypothetical protein
MDVLILVFVGARSFAATGSISVVVAWFILPEVTRRTPGEIDELYVYHGSCPTSSRLL